MTIQSSLAFVFPGQGSQSVGMMSALAADFPVVQQTFEEASEVLRLDLWALVQTDPDGALNQTVNTQPAMLAAGVATWRVWCESSQARPGYMAGHSLGEYTALVCAESLAYADAVKLVRDRGQFMQGAVPGDEGAMAAILGVDDDHVMDACVIASTTDEKVAPANYNAPGQVVIAGHRPAVLRAIDECKSLGAKRAVLLPVSVPSHCGLMLPAAQQLDTVLAGVALKLPKIPVLHNVDVSVQSGLDGIRQALVSQLYSPVRWVETVSRLSELGVEQIVECGPGKVLTGLNKRIAPGSPTLPVIDRESLKLAMEKYT